MESFYKTISKIRYVTFVFKNFEKNKYVKKIEKIPVWIVENK